MSTTWFAKIWELEKFSKKKDLQNKNVFQFSHYLQPFIFVNRLRKEVVINRYLKVRVKK